MKWIIFKPTIGKIVLALILFSIFVPFIKPHGYECIKAPCQQPGTQTLLTQFLFIKNPIIGVYFWNLVIGLIASYLVSCLLLSFAMNNVKKRENE